MLFKIKTDINGIKLNTLKIYFLPRSLRTLYNMSWDWESFLLPVFVNNLLLKYSHVYFLTYCLWVFSYYNGRVEKLQHLLSGAKNFKCLLSGSLKQKFPNHCTRAYIYLDMLVFQSKTGPSYWLEGPCLTI